MAITRSQQAKQMLQNGGRIGLRGGADAATASFGKSVGFKDSKTGSTGRPDKDFNPGTGGSGPTFGDAKASTLTKDQINQAKDFKALQKFKSNLANQINLPSFGPLQFVLNKAMKPNFKYRNEFLKNNPQLKEYLESLDEDDQKKAMVALADVPNVSGQNFEDFLAFDKGAPALKYKGNVGGLEKFVSSYEMNPDGTFKLSPRGYKIAKTYGYRDRPDGNDAYIFPRSGIMANNANASESNDTDEVAKKEDDSQALNLRLLAEGGRIGLQGGGADLGTASSRDFGFGDRDARDDAAINRRMQNIGAGGGGGSKGPDTPLRFKKDIPDNLLSSGIGVNMKNLIDFGLINQENEEDNTQLAKVFGEQDLKNIGAVEEGFFGNKLTDQGEILESFRKKAVSFKDAEANTANTPQAALDFITAPNKAGVKSFQDIRENKDFIQGAIDKGFLDNPSDYENQKPLDTFSTGGRAGLAEGGMPYEGGIMDLESARQMYGLGKLVKKIGRSVKKIVKSPIGKAAIAAAAFKFGPAFFGKNSFNPFLKIAADGSQGFSPFGAIARKLGIATLEGGLTGFGKVAALGVPSVIAGLTTKQEENDDEELYAGADLPFPVDYYLSGQYAPNIRLAAEGGLMRARYQKGSKEPVAKKTMPLLDMGGMEKDYREEGGFVPIGRMEKADDVPARLSKNEFVFTADAVRNAGDGDVDLGAEKMYNMMKNLEAGGDVSEESQGLEGAKKMFQTSQRLEEVL